MKTLAFYLPQFHPFKENDEFWGKGFTEWQNVARAVPQYEGHIQPNIPSELGFYDLRLSNILYEQFYLANQHGIDGFVPYLYWFCDGKVLMEDVIVQFSGGNVPYALCWANENWTRRWDGRDDDVLIEQRYENPELLCDYLIENHFSNQNYIRDKWSRPVFIIYRPHHNNMSAVFVRQLKHFLEKKWGDVLLLGCGSFEDYPPDQFGLSGVIQFPPHRQGHATPHRTGVKKKPKFKGAVYDYEEMARFFANDNRCAYKTVSPNWDNTPRRMDSGHIFCEGENAPAVFGQWVRDAAQYTKDNCREFMFINAWNEWAEGAYLEPDTVRGRTRLEALKAGLNLTK